MPLPDQMADSRLFRLNLGTHMGGDPLVGPKIKYGKPFGASLPRMQAKASSPEKMVVDAILSHPMEHEVTG